MPGPVRRAILIPFFVSLIITGCRRAPINLLDRPQLEAGVRMQDVVFRSDALGREMSYRIYLPANVSPSHRLPVVYLLHGAGDNFRTWSNQSDVAQYARQNILLVMPDGGLSYYMNAVEAPADKYEDYITKDLIADVQNRFPAANNRENRAIIGISMGGLAAINYAFAHPDLYIFAGALSPAVDVPSRPFRLKRIDQWWRFRTIFGPVGSEERRMRNPFELVRTANPPATPYIYMTAGEQEPLLGPIRQFAARLKERGFAYEFHTRPGGHDWTEWNEQIPGCFESLFKVLPAQASQ